MQYFIHSFFYAIVLFQASFNVEIQVVLAHRVRELPLFFHNLYFILIFNFLDLTSNFIVIFYMTHLNLWKKIRKFIVWFYLSFHVFALLINSEISIAFTITMYEYLATIPTLWKHVMGSFFFLLSKLIFLLTYSFIYFRFCSWPSRIYR